MQIKTTIRCHFILARLAITSSVQFSRSIVSNSLRPHGLQHARPPCPSPTPGVYPNSCPLSRWCHPTISSSVVPFFSCPQSFPASGSFQMSQLFASGGQSIGVSASHQSRQWPEKLNWESLVEYELNGQSDEKHEEYLKEFQILLKISKSFLIRQNMENGSDKINNDRKKLWASSINKTKQSVFRLGAMQEPWKIDL